jgi:hypothetical protein
MRMNSRAIGVLGSALLMAGMCLLFLVMVAPELKAQSTDDFDSYKVRLEGHWVYSNPSGSIEGSAENSAIDLKGTLGYKSYSTFAGKLDWKFTRKNHLYFVGIPFNRSHETVLTRTIVFEGKTFQAGLTTHSNLDANMYGIGYQYDIIRRKRGHLGIAAQLNLFDVQASIDATAQVTGDGVHHAAASASGSSLALIPVAGPEFRLYLTNSPRVFIDGQVTGMYFFGYGNFVSAGGSLGVSITRHVGLKAGYQVGSRLAINNDSSTNRIGLRLTQKGPFAGLEFSF